MICLRRVGDQFYGDISWVGDDISVPSLVFMKKNLRRLARQDSNCNIPSGDFVFSNHS